MANVSRAPWSRRRFLKSAGVVPSPVAFGAAKRRPNVLFLLTDDQRQDTIHALGNAAIRTPNLDGLVRNGVTFRNGYCMGGYSPAVCLPSRQMMLRGRSWISVQKMSDAVPNLAQSMNEAGYDSFHYGKRGNEDLKVHKYFTHNHYVTPDDQEERRTGRPGMQMAERVGEYLDQWKGGSPTKPFFMYLAGPAPHDPRVAPPEYLAMYPPEKLPLPPNFKPYHPFDNGEMYIRDERLAPWPRTGAEIRRHLREYYAVITHLDEQIGRIFSKLRAIGEYDNTIIVFTSDQGIAIGSHGLMGKQNLYEHSMNPGIIFSGPGIPRGKRLDAFAYLFDIYPTVVDLVGAKAPEPLEGKSLAPVVRGQSRAVRDTVFLAYRDIQRAVRRGRWKMIRYPRVDVTQLFDLETDPYETRDLAGDPRHAARMEELLKLMREQQTLFGDTTPLTVDSPQPSKIDLEFFKKAPPEAQKGR